MAKITIRIHPLGTLNVCELHPVYSYSTIHLFLAWANKHFQPSPEAALSRLLSELWPSLMWLTQLMLDRSPALSLWPISSLTLSFALFLMHIHANTHLQPHTDHLPLHTHTNMHTHIQFNHYLYLTPGVSCCGYLHHKQLEDTGGPLTGKCTCHKEMVYYLQQHKAEIS